MKTLSLISAGLLLTALFGCGQASNVSNPFLTATEALGAAAFRGGTDEQGGGQGAEQEAAFRQTMIVTLANNHQEAELNTSFAAWVNPNSIRSIEQQDELIADGYIELTSELRLGSAFTLAPGTFVYNGPGVAGATSVRLVPTRASTEEAVDPTLATTREFEIVTPDAILIFSQPPVSCDSVAFFYTIDGDPLTSEGLSGVGNIFAGPTTPFGGLKTFAQVDVYECDPFRPGLFLRIGGGALPDNEFFEGQDIRVDFLPVATDAGFFAVVTKTTP
jgi:hypothetical protein